jgi:Helix-turn-helix domain/RodZ C-terminal domain
VPDGVGATLREARERREIPISEVVEATKIRPRFLHAIENEEWDVLPGSAYARSFIRTYADFLGLDGARLAAEHHQAPTPVPGPHVEPDPIGPGQIGRRPRVSRGLLAALACVALVALLVVAGLSGGDGGGAPEDGSKPGEQANHVGPGSGGGKREGLSMDLAATGEVWVCVLDDSGRELVEGEILPTGEEVGPFHSGSFTVAFGNGAIAMSIDGKEAEIPETSSPIGYTIDSEGELTELAETERPTCQ